MSSTAERATFEAAFKSHDRYLWSVLFRMTGCAADADDLLQETFARALENPPASLERPLRPWLLKVAVNLGRDHLRKRKKSPYVGPWLPSPIETEASGDLPPSYEVPTTEARYDLLESVTFAFLVALEALKPSQRAVLLLRDVFDYSVRETAEALDLSEDNTKTLHLRARRAMEKYEANRTRVSVEHRERTMRVVSEFFGHLAAQNVPAIEGLLAADVRASSDGAGEFNAALRTIFGKKKVRLFFQKLTSKNGLPTWFDVRLLNGMPAIIAEYQNPRPRIAKRIAIIPIVGEDGLIHELDLVVATRKLSALRFASAAQSS